MGMVSERETQMGCSGGIINFIKLFCFSVCPGRDCPEPLPDISEEISFRCPGGVLFRLRRVLQLALSVIDLITRGSTPMWGGEEVYMNVFR